MFLLAFVLLMSYEVARSPVESLFVDAHGSRLLPAAWTLVAAMAVVLVSIYNRFAARYDLGTIFGAVALISAAVLVLALLGRDAGVPGASYALYVWKDMYIVVLLEIFWSVANTRFDVARASKLYGLFCVMGSLGAMSGGLLVAGVAEDWGTERTLYVVLPLLGLCWLMRGLLRGKRQAGGETLVAAQGLAILKRSRYLLLMLLLIATVQLVITLVDYQYNVMLEATYPDKDTRSAVGAMVYTWISAGSLALQLLTGPVLKLFGVSLVLLAIPGIIGAAVGAFALVPRFLTMAVSKVAGKCFDYSLFRAAKEILYIPLSYPEKTQGKAFIDMMTYRVAKGGVSLLVLWLALLDALAAITVLTLGLITVWVWLTVRITRRYRARTGS